MNYDTVRVRFAPSPTGPLHLGGVRTALYNYLFAKKHNGSFILRIEDTDRQRLVKGAEEYILASLKWCGLAFDEDIVQGGPYAPYRQSDRSAVYREYIGQLVTSGHAYYAFDTAEALEAARTRVPAGEEPFQYNYKTRKVMQNSLSLSAEEVKMRLEKGDPYVIRIRIPEDEVVDFHDLIRGQVSVHTAHLDDKVLFKSDGLPTYHLANVVDDYLMKITHVIRGEEWLPSAPMHLLLYRFFGWEKQMPAFAHLPLILKPEGNGKLSKRDGDRLGFPVFPLQWTDPVTGEVSHGYREDGYLPEAFINMLALLGWNPGTEQELFSLEGLTEAFSIDRVGKHGSKFDPEKAKWFNHQYLARLSEETFLTLFRQQLAAHQITASDDYILQVLRLIRERAHLLPELWDNSWYFFKDPETYDPSTLSRHWKPTTGELLRSFLHEINLLREFNKDTLHEAVTVFSVSKGIKMGLLMNPLRLLVVGSGQGPGMMDIAVLLGKETFIRRIEKGIQQLNNSGQSHSL